MIDMIMLPLARMILPLSFSKNFGKKIYKRFIKIVRTETYITRKVANKAMIEYLDAFLKCKLTSDNGSISHIVKKNVKNTTIMKL